MDISDHKTLSRINIMTYVTSELPHCKPILKNKRIKQSEVRWTDGLIDAYSPGFAQKC